MKFFDRGSLCLPGTIFLIIGFAAGFLASISLPWLPALEVARTNFNTELLPSDTIKQARLGVWAGCGYTKNDKKECTPTGHAYNFGVLLLDKGGEERIVKSSWTRGLVVTPVATGVAFLALIFALIPGGAWGLIASGTAFLASFIMLLAFIIDIVLLLHQKSVFDIPGAHTSAGAGFWLTFISLIFLLVAGCTVCIGHRRSKGEDIEMGGLFKRLRR